MADETHRKDTFSTCSFTSLPCDQTSPSPRQERPPLVVRENSIDAKRVQACRVEVFIPNVQTSSPAGQHLLPAERSADVTLQGGVTGAVDIDLHLEGGGNAALLGEGFVPVATLTLNDLPECIRAEKHLRKIKKVSQRVVCINNNDLSPERPADFSFGGQKSLCGSGLLLMISNDIGVISTNRHVLYNDAEVRKASVDVFYDLPMKEAFKAGQIKRIGRGKGLGTIRANLDEDFTIALFRFKKFDRDSIEDGAKYFPELMVHDCQDGRDGEDSGPQVACVISHPLGCPKQVSFGTVLLEDPASRRFLHDAATREGSSGAPILIFSPTRGRVLDNSVWYHVGSLPESGGKLAHLQVNNPRLFHVNLERYLRLEPSLPEAALDAWMSSWFCMDDDEELKRALAFAEHFPEMNLEATNIAVSLSLCLCTFLLRLDKFLPRMGDKSSWKSCDPLPRDVLEEQLKSRGMALERITGLLDTLAFDLLPPGLRHKRTEEGDFFIDWLLNRGPCHCRHILSTLTAIEKEETAESNDPLAHHSYLPPDAFPEEVRQTHTWPFMCGNTQENEKPARVRAEEGCLILDIIKCVGDPPFQDPAFCMVLVLLELAEALLRYHTAPRPQDPANPRPPLPLRLPEKPVSDIMAVTMYLMLAGLSAATSFTEILNQQCRECLGAYPVIKDELGRYTAASRPTKPAADGHLAAPDRPEVGTGEGLSRPTDDVTTATVDAWALLRHVTQHSMQEHGDEAESAAEERCQCDRPTVSQLLAGRKAVAAPFLSQFPVSNACPPPQAQGVEDRRADEEAVSPHTEPSGNDRRHSLENADESRKRDGQAKSQQLSQESEREEEIHGALKSGDSREIVENNTESEKPLDEDMTSPKGADASPSAVSGTVSVNAPKDIPSSLDKTSCEQTSGGEDHTIVGGETANFLGVSSQGLRPTSSESPMESQATPFSDPVPLEGNHGIAKEEAGSTALVSTSPRASDLEDGESKEDLQAEDKSPEHQPADDGEDSDDGDGSHPFESVVHEWRTLKTRENRLALVTKNFLTPSWVCGDISLLFCFEDMAGWNVDAARQRLKQARTIDLDTPKAENVKAVLKEKVAPSFPATIQAIRRLLASREVLLYNCRQFLRFCRSELGIEFPESLGEH